MKRSRMHFAFALAALGFGLTAAYQGWRLQHAAHVNEAIAGANAASLHEGIAEALFARALHLSGTGRYDGAVKAYKALIHGNRIDLRRAALYNLGNLHMREALRDGPENAIHSLPLIELAKQNYRDLLREDPADWNARYNLERALWLAPEFEEEFVEEEGPRAAERRVIRDVPGFRIELP